MLMLSRVANAIYWMSRYIERAENAARFVDVNHHLMLDRAGGGDEQWMPLVNITGDAEVFTRQYGRATRQNVTDFLAFGAGYANSIASCVRLARENARTIRDTITEEMWEQVNAIHIMIGRAGEEGFHQLDPSAFYRNVKQATQLFNGITDATMSRSLGWDFVHLGRMIERADKTSRIVDVKYFLLLPRPEDVGGTVDILQWTALLRSTSALEMYRQTHGAILPAHVAAFLILDDKFPRSLKYCLYCANQSLSTIAGSQPLAPAAEALRRAGRLHSELEFATIEEVVKVGMHEYLDQFQRKLNAVDDAINGAFFQVPSDPPPPQPPLRIIQTQAASETPA